MMIHASAAVDWNVALVRGISTMAAYRNESRGAKLKIAVDTAKK
jgi:hypothetical protein